ncbi:hypothetical protein [Bosea vaviloviae]|uniref:hypothetical protein n=1 Tax=Bosea vaviloviae TaxID=1526658 RepID=UPI001314F480|nr:hypothetical protein [Bosea vaviloviae]
MIEAHYQSNWGRLRNPGDARSRIRAQIDGTYWRGILLVEHILLVLLVMFGPHLFLP